MSGATLLLLVAAQAASTDLPVSLERIRAALAAPPPAILLPADSAPTFAVRVQARRPGDWISPLMDLGAGGVRTPVAAPRQLGGIVTDPPLVSVDVLPIARALGRALRETRRSRAEQAAREEVKQTIAAFCRDRACE